MKINPLNIVNKPKAPKESKRTIGNNKIQQIADYTVDARNLIDIGTVMLDGAMLFGYAKFCRQEFEDLD